MSDNIKEAYAVVEWNAEDNDHADSITYLYDTKKNIEKNFVGQNVTIYLFESTDFCELSARRLIGKNVPQRQYTVDASFANYLPSYGYQLFFNARSINGLQYLKTDNMQDMKLMFAFSSVKSLDLSNFNTSNVVDMAFMFYKCSSLKSLDLSNFDTSKATNMQGLFNKCDSIEDLKVGHGFFNNIYTNDKLAHALLNNDILSWYVYQLCEGSSAEKLIITAFNKQNY